jgi:hypothetical protein
MPLYQFEIIFSDYVALRKKYANDFHRDNSDAICSRIMQIGMDICVLVGPEFICVPFDS